MNQEEPNNYQIAGTHYQTKDKYQLWDLIIDIDLNFLLANAIKYIYRCKNKNGVQDLDKAKHYIDKFFNLDRMLQNKLTNRPICSPTNILDTIPKKINNFLQKETTLSRLQKTLIEDISRLTFDNDNSWTILDRVYLIVLDNLELLNEELKKEIESL